MSADRPFLTEARVGGAMATLAACGAIFAAALAAHAWLGGHTAPEKPAPKICYVAPIRGGGGMVTFCAPEARP